LAERPGSTDLLKLVSGSRRQWRPLNVPTPMVDPMSEAATPPLHPNPSGCLDFWEDRAYIHDGFRKSKSRRLRFEGHFLFLGFPKFFDGKGTSRLCVRPTLKVEGTAKH
jgi:hypothetical protein